MEQLDIFQINANNTFNSMLEKLDKYGIDEYYRNHYKGNCELLSVIEEGLKQLPCYYEYRTKMFELLKEHFKDRKDVELIYYEDYDYIRIYEPKSTGPLYCLEMLDREIFIS